MRFLYIVIFSVSVYGNTYSQNTSKLDDSSLLNLIIDYGKTYKGVKYKYGSCSASNNGFDCSGFINYIFKMAGIELPRSSSEMAIIGDKLDLINIKKGDFLFFNTLNSGRISHVGIVSEINKDKIIMLHVSSSKGVQEIDILKSDYWYARLTSVRDVFHDK
ncbi:MAG: cell wall-associated NlpC family hydrolase [Planctomycetota bacterium]|jgi:cell wall-associated NlpC family hydrolase